MVAMSTRSTTLANGQALGDAVLAHVRRAQERHDSVAASLGVRNEAAFPLTPEEMVV